MARPKKNQEPITGFGKDPENALTVQKAIPLFSLWRSDMSLAEFKILDTYLSRINSHQPEKRTVIFTKGELESLLGVTKINKSALSSRLKGLGRFVPIEKSDHKIHEVALFEEAYGEKDENGLWTVRLTCTPSAMQYIFNIENFGYLKYRLRCVTCLTSRYAYILHLYLEHNRFRKTWEVDLVTLRNLLKCTAERYKEFKFFNSEVLKKCQKELHERTECRFSYTPIKNGKTVVAIRFSLETLSDSIEPALPGQMVLDAYQDEDPLAIYRGVLPSSLTNEEVDALRILAAKKVPFSDGSHPRECCIADYLRLKVVMMNASQTKKTRPFNYLKAMIEQDPDF